MACYMLTNFFIDKIDLLRLGFTTYINKATGNLHRKVA